MNNSLKKVVNSCAEMIMIMITAVVVVVVVVVMIDSIDESYGALIVEDGEGDVEDLIISTFGSNRC